MMHLHPPLPARLEVGGTRWRRQKAAEDDDVDVHDDDAMRHTPDDAAIIAR
jgi:hypothetical protein